MRTPLFMFVIGMVTACEPGQANIYNEPTALLFEDDACVTVSGDALDLGSAFTFEMYVQGTQTPTGSHGPLITFGNVLMLWTSPTATWLSEPADNPTTGILTGTTLYDGNIHHIAGHWSDDDMGALYIDGQRYGTGQTMAAIRIADTLNIGCWADGGHFFEGVIDEVRISTGVRYPTLFIPPTDTLEYDESTLALWHFDQGTGQTVHEETDRFLGTTSGTSWVAGLTTVQSSEKSLDTGEQ